MDDSWENWHLHMEMDCDDDFLKKHCCDELLGDILRQPPPAFSSESGSDLSVYAFQNNNSSFPAVADGVVLTAKEKNENLVKSNSSNSIASQSGSKGPGRSSSQRSYILSFDNSTMVPATPEPCLGGEGRHSSNSNSNSNSNSYSYSYSPLPSKRGVESEGPDPRMRPKQGAKRVRNSAQTADHIMAERRRRQELTERFIALSATIPGLNKTDKASVLRAAIDYVKQLQERVQELEKQDNREGVESVIFTKKPDPSGNEDTEMSLHNCSILPEMEARVLGKEVLIEIHCEKENGIELKILDHLENLHLNVTGTSVLPFGNSALCITIIVQTDDFCKMTVDELVKNLGQVLLKSHVICKSDPY